MLLRNSMQAFEKRRQSMSPGQARLKAVSEISEDSEEEDEHDKNIREHYKLDTCVDMHVFRFYY